MFILKIQIKVLVSIFIFNFLLSSIYLAKTVYLLLHQENGLNNTIITVGLNCSNRGGKELNMWKGLVWNEFNDPLDTIGRRGQLSIVN